MTRAAARLEFAPPTWPERARFELHGRWLIARALRALAYAPLTLTTAERYRVQATWAARLLAHFDVDLTIGPVSPAARGPAIVVALHEGVADVLCLLQLGLPLRFAVREEIFEWPGVGAALSRMGHVPINPENGARAYRAMLRAARASLAAGESFAIFPQGTVLGIETAFKCGAFRLAQELRAPIVPVVLTGAHRVWEHPFSARLRYGQRVAAVALDAVPASVVSSMSAESLRGRVEQRMKAVALSGQVPAPRRYVPERDGYWDGYAFEIDPRFAEVAARIAKERQRD